MSKEWAQRKRLRLKEYDYSSAGAYFITIRLKEGVSELSTVIAEVVGDGAPDITFDKRVDINVEDGALDVPKTPHIQLTQMGEIIKKYLLSSERISGVKIDEYVIMPNHIHAIIILKPKGDVIPSQDGTSRAPSPTNTVHNVRTNETLPRIIAAFKRFCNKELGENIFQRGYMEHVIRDEEDYLVRVKYIQENPIRWYYR